MTTTVYFATNRIVNHPQDRPSSYTFNIVSPVKPQEVTYATAFVDSANLTADTVHCADDRRPAMPCDGASNGALASFPSHLKSASHRASTSATGTSKHRRGGSASTETILSRPEEFHGRNGDPTTP